MHSALKAQCPVQDVTWARINGIGKSSLLTPPEKLATLTDCLKKLEAANCVNDSTHALLLRRIGFVYEEQSDYVKAIHYLRLSIQIIESNIAKPAINPRHLVNNYFFLSRFYDVLNNPREKMKAIDSCISVSIRFSSTQEISCILSFEARAAYFFGLGEYKSCIDEAEKCEREAWKYVAANKEYADFGRQLALTSIGWLLEALIRLKNFEKAEAFLSAKKDEFKKSGHNKYLGFVYSQLGQVEIQKGNYRKALSFFNESLRREKQGRFDFTCKQILNTVGHDVYLRGFNDAAQALRCYHQALTYTNKDKRQTKEDTIESIEILTRIGDVYVRQGAYEAAFANFQQAFNLLRPGITESDIILMPVDQIATYRKTYIIAGLIISKGDAFLARYKLHKNPTDIRKATDVYKVADRLLVMIGANHTDLQSKLFWRSQSRRLYEQAIEACHIAGNAQEAFYFFEKSRAVLLNEQLAQQSLLNVTDIARQMQLQKRMDSLKKARDIAGPHSKLRSDIENKLFFEQQNMDRFVQGIKAKNPLYYQTVLDTSVPRLAHVYNSLLKNHQTILEIFSGDSAVYALHIMAGKTILKKIDKAAFEHAAGRYIAFIASRQRVDNDFAGFKAVAHQLYLLIFQNIPAAPGRIIISPDGQNFPFESLVVNNTASAPVYFLNNHAVSYTYSVRYLLNNFASAAPASSGNFMGIAPVHFGNRLSSLPGSDGSLTRIASYYGSAANFVGTLASKKNFANHFANYSIIQLYSHASANGPAREPVIYFADSALSLSDLLLETKPATRLIVLSACETGNGQLYLGEGVFSFNRGFAACGIPSSITNLWSVDNLATYKITELFYKHLSDGRTMDVALQLAKKEFLETGSRQEQLPYYWAAAVLVGKTEALTYKSRPSGVPSLLLAGLLCLFAFAAVAYSSLKTKVVSV